MYDNHMKAIVAAWNDGDLDGLDAFVASDTIRRTPTSVSSAANNLAELKQVITEFRTAFPDAKVTILEFFSVDDRSMARWTYEGTNTGPGQFPPTGRAVKIEGCSFSKYKGGKLVEEVIYFDGMELLIQLGLVESPA
jgi:steroid delta-isomerase-like uncharacterized protein